jgi:hypothetical protein
VCGGGHAGREGGGDALGATGGMDGRHCRRWSVEEEESGERRALDGS